MRASVTLGEVKEHVIPAGDCMLRFTTPMKSELPATVMVELPVDPELIAGGETGPADIAKSPTCTV